VVYKSATTAIPAPINAPSSDKPVGAAPAVVVNPPLAADATLEPPDATVEASDVATEPASLVAVENAPPAPEVIVLATPVATDPAPDVTTV
jgi:hypothetical protein